MVKAGLILGLFGSDQRFANDKVIFSQMILGQIYSKKIFFMSFHFHLLVQKSMIFWVLFGFFVMVLVFELFVWFLYLSEVWL